MKKILVTGLFTLSISAFISALIIPDARWSEFLIASAIVLLLVGLRTAVPEPIISKKR